MMNSRISGGKSRRISDNWQLIGLAAAYGVILILDYQFDLEKLWAGLLKLVSDAVGWGLIVLVVGLIAKILWPVFRTFALLIWSVLIMWFSWRLHQ